MWRGGREWPEFDGLKSLRLLIQSYMGMKSEVCSKEWPRVQNGALLRFRHCGAGKGVYLPGWDR